MARQMPGRVVKKPRRREWEELHCSTPFQLRAYTQKKSSRFCSSRMLAFGKWLRNEKGNCVHPWRKFANSTCRQERSRGTRRGRDQGGGVGTVRSSVNGFFFGRNNQEYLR